MAHFAELDENNIVKRVIVVSNLNLLDNNIEKESVGIEYCQKLFGQETRWKQTSYNKNIRKRYAGIGMIYNEELDAYISPQPYSSWTLNSDTTEWEPPIPYPESNTETYTWNEDNQSWDQLEDQ